MKRLLVRAALVFALVAGAHAVGATPAQAEMCVGVHEDAVGTFEVCVPI